MSLQGDTSRDSNDLRIRRCTDADAMYVIINEAAEAYRGVIPEDCWHEPYMSHAELKAEIAAGVNFWGWEKGGVLAGIMGIQKSRDAMLIRHAYVSPGFQGQGVGRALLEQLIGQAQGLLLVGTWAAARWAIRFYEQHGFRLVLPHEKDQLLGLYWTVSPRQTETSVVLKYER